MKAMPADFLTNIETMHTEALLKTETDFVNNKKAWFADFASHFQQTCTGIRKLQDNATLSEITYFEYTMLRANFINRLYIAEAYVYGDKYYLDKNQRIVGEYDVSFLFTHFHELWDRLLSERKRYIGKVSAREVTSYMMNVLPDYYSYLTNIARFAIADCVDKSPFTDIDKNDVFRVNVGEYMAKTANIYTEKKDKDAGILAKSFNEQLKEEYTFDDYSGLDFSERSFTYTGFRYSQFRNACLNNTSLQGCVLIGTNFHKADMKNCCLDNCSIYEADFSYATLKSASFINAHGRAGLPNNKEWHHVGFLPVNFRYSDLTGVNFSGANLSGADFTGATLTGAVFTDAVLDGAIFD